MDSSPPQNVADEFIAMCGAPAWRERLATVKAGAATSRSGRVLQQVHAIELIVERLRLGQGDRKLTAPERIIAGHLQDAVALHDQLSSTGQARFRAQLADGMREGQTLMAVFHVLRTAALQRSRGFEVGFAALQDGAPFDLSIRSGAAEAEIACDVMSAEEGRIVHRGAWYRLVDLIDPDLQTWLRAHPGRYLLKLTFPVGLKLAPEDERLLPGLHARITQMLAAEKRADGGGDGAAAVVLRLDPLMLAAAQSDELGLMPRLRREFGPEAQLAVTTSGGGVFVMAARGGQQNDIAAAVRRRMEAVAPARLTGSRPGILAMFVEDTDRLEWRLLRERLELEGEARQFMTNPAARGVVAVTCSSRLEMFGIGEPDGAVDGELRFRNPAHPAAKRPELAPAVLSSV